MSNKKPKSILVVEDSLIDRELLKNAFSLKGYDVRCAGSGAECLDILAQSLPDIVLLDMMLPDSRGDLLLSEIRVRYNAIELPVIMVTSVTDSQVIINALSLGANDYITKPVDFGVASRRVETQMLITELSLKAGLARQLEAVRAMVATYNHEINNPLSIAIGYVEACTDPFSSEDRAKLAAALWRISDIVKKIEKAASSEAIELERYGEVSKMVKVK